MTTTHRQIRDFVNKNFIREDGDYTNDKSLLYEGIVDSTGFLEIVTWVEDTYKFTVSDSEITPENFGSIDNMVVYIAHKTAAVPA